MKRIVVSPRQEKEARYQDGRNIPSGMSFKQQQIRERGVSAEELRGDERCGGFVKGIIRNSLVLGSVNEHIWSGEAFTPDGVPDGDVYEPKRNRREEPMCDRSGRRIY